MHHCWPTTQHIEDTARDLMEQNEPPPLPEAPSLEINNEFTNASENIDAIASDQDSNSERESADLIEVSPNRANLRSESCKHLKKQACGIIKNDNLKGSNIKVGDVVQIGISAIDLTKTNIKNFTLLVIEKKTFRKHHLNFSLLINFFK